MRVHNCVQLKNFVLYKGHEILEVDFTALYKRIICALIVYVDKIVFRVIVR